MHIGFRTSGGRGEYEVVGGHSGYSAASLEAWEFYMRWPDGTVRDTGLWLDPGDSGKPRLRSVLKPAVQIGRIVASMLLLPDPTRSFKTTPVSWPITVAKRYSITQVGFGPESEFAEAPGHATFVPSWIEVANQASSDAIGVRSRWERVVRIYGAANSFSFALRSAVLAHRDYLASGQIVTGALVAIVRTICVQLAMTPTISYSEDQDPLPALEQLLGLPEPSGPTLPPPDELTEDEPAISARSAYEYRLARSRGPAGRKFSEAVRAAYGHRCAFCGAKYGALEGIRSGIDAAHILAWSKHDLDIVCNGIALCKLHHWAFDAGIMMPTKEGDDYFTRFTVLADRIEARSLDRLGADGERIPEEWLPENVAQRPSPTYLRRLYADLGVTFNDSV